MRIVHGKRMESPGLTAFLNRIDRGRFFVFFARTDILFSESFWSPRSAESKYRINRRGGVGFFTLTESSLVDFCGVL